MPAKKLPEIIVFAGPNGRGNAWKVYQRTQKFYLWNSAFYRQESEIIKKRKTELFFWENEYWNEKNIHDLVKL